MQIRRGRLDNATVVLPRTSEPSARIDDCRRLFTVDHAVPGGRRNKRPNRVLGFDDDIGDQIGPFTVDALNGGRGRCCHRCTREICGGTSDASPVSRIWNRRSQKDGVTSSRVRKMFQTSAC